MICITINSAKGGVGKSTAAISIATILSSRGNKVILIDLDPQSCATKHLAPDYDWEKTIRHVLLGKQSLSDVIIQVNSHFSLAPSQLTLQSIEQEIEDYNPLYLLHDALESVADDYDYCIIDTAPDSNSLLTRSAFVSSDYVIIPAICEAWPVEAIEITVDSINKAKKAQKYLNKKMKKYLILPSLWDDRRVVIRGFHYALKQEYSDFLSENVIHRSAHVQRLYSTPGQQLQKGDKAFTEYSAVIDELLRSDDGEEV